ncbi:DUF2523 domain-containing protein [Caballeronia sordidicola]|jgi:hypothetical protein|uniref:DUF2523 domain-containing protein n=1 Tax=Caballeronia sordidicola TaxID=196367 RepID=A0A226WV22_CABSO|nr:DUF2523 domain-containing protein [Caballeronia sordidicola]OXC75021.1 hypothetical protein BSU04_29030 [Caballeronia sordidicola]
MFGILVSALNVFLGFVLRTVVVKLVVYAALYLFVSEAITFLQAAHIFPTVASLASGFGGVGEGMWYFMDLCAFSVGAPLILTAYVSRFIIRRIPLIG